MGEYKRQRLKGQNCYEAPKGNGFCDNCSNEKPELCRYTNTYGALALIESLQTQLKEAEAKVEKQNEIIAGTKELTKQIKDIY